MKNLIFAAVLIICFTFLGVKIVSNEKKHEPNKLYLLNEELITQGEIIVSKGKLANKQEIKKDDWKPFNKKVLKADLVYEYLISYSFDSVKVQKHNDGIIIMLGDGFIYNQPALVDQDFTLEKQIFSGKMPKETYDIILDQARQEVYNEITTWDKERYKLAVEKSIRSIANKLYIDKITFIWE